MKVLVVSSEFPPGPGGIGTHAHQLATQLHRFGRSVRAVASQDYASDDEIAAFTASQPFAIDRVVRIPTPAAKLAYRWQKLSRVIRSWRPDVMIASGDREIYGAALVAGQLPWIAIEHGRKPATRWERSVKRWAFGRATCVVSVSNYSHGQLLALGVTPRSSQVIPNGASPERFAIGTAEQRAQVLAELGLAKARLILSVGHVSERKGQDVLIAAMPRILERCPDAQYLIVGKPTRAAQFLELAGRLGVAEHVHMLGQVEDRQLRLLLGACDVHAMTSRHTADQFEGYGIAVVEAAFCGKPSVVSGNSGLVEAIVPGETGLVARPDDPDDTASAVIELLTDDALRTRMGDAARRRALAEQTWEQVVRRYDELLLRLVRS